MKPRERAIDTISNIPSLTEVIDAFHYGTEAEPRTVTFLGLGTVSVVSLGKTDVPGYVRLVVQQVEGARKGETHVIVCNFNDGVGTIQDREGTDPEAKLRLIKARWGDEVPRYQMYRLGSISKLDPETERWIRENLYGGGPVAGIEVMHFGPNHNALTIQGAKRVAPYLEIGDHVCPLTFVSDARSARFASFEPSE